MFLYIDILAISPVPNLGSLSLIQLSLFLLKILVLESIHSFIQFFLSMLLLKQINDSKEINDKGRKF